MTGGTGQRDEALRDAAAGWLVRLQADDVGEADALGFDAWLRASPEHGRAYDRAAQTAHAIQARAPEIRRSLDAGASSPRARTRPAPGQRRYLLLGAMAAAAVAAVVMPALMRQEPVQVLTTGKGERRTLTLADGSKLDLNSATRLSVRMGRNERRVILAEGEAVFDVVHDPARPFYVDAGDRTVRVVGTQFDVRRRGGQLSVTVARGLVEVQPAKDAEGRRFRLHPGQRLDRREGAAEARLSAARPDEVLGWRTGRLVYRDQPLAEVVADLNQQFPRPIRLEDHDLGERRISGVLVLDDQAAVIRRLGLLVPITAEYSETGVSLRRAEASQR